MTRRKDLEKEFIRKASGLPQELVQNLLALTPDEALIVKRRDLRRSLERFLTYIYAEGIIAYKPYIEVSSLGHLVVRYEPPSDLIIIPEEETGDEKDNTKLE